MEKPDMNKPAFSLFPAAAEAIRQDLCPTCLDPIGSFRDSLSEREFGISGMCQKCQDLVFNEDDGEQDHDDMYDIDSALSSAGFGTDEDYGYYDESDTF